MRRIQSWCPIALAVLGTFFILANENVHSAGSDSLPGTWTNGRFLVNLAIKGTAVTGSFSWTEGRQSRTGNMAGTWDEARRLLTATWSWQEEGESRLFKTSLTLAAHGITLDGIQWGGPDQEGFSAFSLRKVSSKGAATPLDQDTPLNVPNPPEVKGIPPSPLPEAEPNLPGGTEKPVQPTNLNPPPQPPSAVANLARGKPATMSSQYDSAYPGANGLDGNPDSMFHTLSEKNAWWQVDLQGTCTLTQIILRNRTDGYQDRASSLQVLLSQDGSNWQTIYAHNGSDFQNLQVDAGGRTARYVRVQLAEQNYLHLGEVEVYGTGPITPLPQAQPPPAEANLARGKPATMSSQYPGPYPASNGVDGYPDSMFHTMNDKNAWWQVDLQGACDLTHIILLNRTDGYQDRASSLQVLLSQDGSNWQTIYTHNGADFQSLRVEAAGRVARYVRVRLAEQNYLHLGEVEVYGRQVPAR